MILIDNSHGSGDSNWRTNIADANFKFSLIDDIGSLSISFSNQNFVDLVNKATNSNKGDILLNRKLLFLKLLDIQQHFKREENITAVLPEDLDIYFLHDMFYYFEYDSSEVEIKKHLSEYIKDNQVNSGITLLHKLLQNAIIKSTEKIKKIPQSKNFIFLENSIDIGNFITLENNQYDQVLKITKDHINKYYKTFEESYTELEKQHNTITEILEIFNKKELSKSDLIDILFKLYSCVEFDFRLFFH